MNPRILMAFLGGVVLASGVAYLSMKPDKPAAMSTVQAPAAAPPAAPAPVAAAPAESAPEPLPAEVKPSPLPEPRSRWRRHEEAAPQRIPRHTVHGAPAPAQPTAQATAQPPQTQPATAAAPASTPTPARPTPDTASEASAVQQAVAPHVEPPPPPKPQTVTLQPGTLLQVRLGETLSTDRNHPGDSFTATLEQPLVVNGFVIAERGSRLEGRVVEADPGGRVRGLARMGVELVRLRTSDGQQVQIHTSPFQRQAQPTHKNDAAKIGAGAAIGAAIGAIAGGGKGAAIGAGVGGAAGTGDVLLTRGKEAEIPVETRMSFRLSDPVTITERLR